MNSVGIDISKGRSTIAVMRPFGEVAISPFEVRHTDSELSELARRLKSLNGETRVVMEATGNYHAPVAKQLHDAGLFFSTQRKSFSKFLAGRILKNLGFHNYLDHGISLLSLKSHETFGSLFCFSYGILQLAIILLLPQQVPCDAGGSSPPPPPEATDQTRLRKN